MIRELELQFTPENGATRTMEMDRSRKCSADCCENAAVTFFMQRNLCLNHFLSRCYEELERRDPRGRNGKGSAEENVALKSFVEECSQKALEISLSGLAQDNLQRGRLLDILLWAGEVVPFEAEQRAKAQVG